MLNFCLNSLNENLLLGGQVTLVGMSTVFVILVLLWAIVAFLKFILYTLPNSRKKSNIKPAKISSAKTGANENEELIAVIAAAIEAFSGIPQSNFRVVSFKRANNNYSKQSNDIM